MAFKGATIESLAKTGSGGKRFMHYQSDLGPEGSTTNNVSIEGREITIGIGTPDDDVSISLSIADDDSVEGSRSTFGAGGSFTGRKIR
jgi:hypothetical protein